MSILNDLNLTADNMAVLQEISNILSDYGVDSRSMENIFTSLNIEQYADHMRIGDYSGFAADIADNLSAVVFGKGIDTDNIDAARTQILGILQRY